MRWEALLAISIGPTLMALAAPAAERWPAFQNGGSVQVESDKLPLSWSAEDGITWAVDLPGYGQSTPIVWDGTVYVTYCAGAMKERLHLRALEVETGKTRWEHEVANSTPEKNTNYVSRAAPTPVADADGVIAFFEGGNVVALDHAGSVRWVIDLVQEHGPIAARHGLASSLEQNTEHVFIWVERSEQPYVLAIEKKTGKVVWKADGVGAATWSSPRLVSLGDDRQHLVLSAIGRIVGLDAATGQRLWDFSDVSNNSTPTPIPLGQGRFLIGASEGRGESSQPPVKSNGVIQISRHDDGQFSADYLWRAEKALSSFGSPIVAGGNAYFVNRAGVVYCLDSETGKQRYAKRIADSIWATPVQAGNRIYLFGRGGTTTVIRQGGRFQVIAENTLWKESPESSAAAQPGGPGGFGGPVLYAVAVAGDRFLLRRGDRIYCVADSQGKSGSPAATAKLRNKGPSPKTDIQQTYAELPRGITSFGAATIDSSLYVYGGHFGRAHHYSNTSQSNELSRLDLQSPKKWEVVATGPRLQGLAMVAHGGKLYRVGGFTARNDEDDEHDLHSVVDFARFDPATNKWESLAPLPEPRSSHDAVVIGDKLYVVGGWQLAGEETIWHQTAWVADLSQSTINWQPLPDPPFQRRALSAGHFDGKLYVIGGMQRRGGPTTRVDVLAPTEGKWATQGSLVGEGMEGFGSSAFNVDGKLFVSTYGGKLQQLQSNGKTWRVVRSLKEDRFFHRMLPFDGRLFLVGGASMESGKRLGLEFVDPASPDDS